MKSFRGLQSDIQERQAIKNAIARGGYSLLKHVDPGLVVAHIGRPELAVPMAVVRTAAAVGHHAVNAGVAAAKSIRRDGKERKRTNKSTDARRRVIPGQNDIGRTNAVPQDVQESRMGIGTGSLLRAAIKPHLAGLGKGHLEKINVKIRHPKTGRLMVKTVFREKPKAGTLARRLQDVRDRTGFPGNRYGVNEAAIRYLNEKFNPVNDNEPRIRPHVDTSNPTPARKLGVNRVRNSRLAKAGKRFVKRVSDAGKKFAASKTGQTLKKVAGKAYNSPVGRGARWLGKTYVNVSNAGLDHRTYKRIGGIVGRSVGLKLKKRSLTHHFKKHGTGGLADRVNRKNIFHSAAGSVGMAIPGGAIGATIGTAVAGVPGAIKGFAIGHQANDSMNAHNLKYKLKAGQAHRQLKARFARMATAAKQGRTYGSKRLDPKRPSKIKTWAQSRKYKGASLWDHIKKTSAKK